MSGFRNIYGHEKTIAHLRSAIVLDQVSHAYLISGDEGMGRTKVLKNISRICLRYGGKQCLAGMM